MTLAAFAVMACLSAIDLRAGWPFSSNGPPRGSDEWYAMHANDPVGERRVYKFGKFWPPQPRPTGPKQLYVHRYYTQKYWPLPYACEDRAATIAVWDAHTANGWQMATTMYEYHFDPETHALNHSGQAHLNWIMSSVPPERRHISIQASADPTTSQIRLANVQAAAAGYQSSGAVDIALRSTPAAGRPAEEVQWIYEQQQQLRTPPQIQYTAVGASK